MEQFRPGIPFNDQLNGIGLNTINKIEYYTEHSLVLFRIQYILCFLSAPPE